MEADDDDDDDGKDSVDTVTVTQRSRSSVFALRRLSNVDIPVEDDDVEDFLLGDEE